MSAETSTSTSTQPAKQEELKNEPISTSTSTTTTTTTSCSIGAESVTTATYKTTTTTTQKTFKIGGLAEEISATPKFRTPPVRVPTPIPSFSIEEFQKKKQKEQQLQEPHTVQPQGPQPHKDTERLIEINVEEEKPEETLAEELPQQKEEEKVLAGKKSPYNEPEQQAQNVKLAMEKEKHKRPTKNSKMRNRAKETKAALLPYLTEQTTTTKEEEKPKKLEEETKKPVKTTSTFFSSHPSAPTSPLGHEIEADFTPMAATSSVFGNPPQFGTKHPHFKVPHLGGLSPQPTTSFYMPSAKSSHIFSTLKPPLSLGFFQHMTVCGDCTIFASTAPKAKIEDEKEINLKDFRTHSVTKKGKLKDFVKPLAKNLREAETELKDLEETQKTQKTPKEELATNYSRYFLPTPGDNMNVLYEDVFHSLKDDEKSLTRVPTIRAVGVGLRNGKCCLLIPKVAPENLLLHSDPTVSQILKKDKKFEWEKKQEELGFGETYGFGTLAEERKAITPFFHYKKSDYHELLLEEGSKTEKTFFNADLGFGFDPLLHEDHEKIDDTRRNLKKIIFSAHSKSTYLKDVKFLPTMKTQLSSVPNDVFPLFWDLRSGKNLIFATSSLDYLAIWMISHTFSSKSPEVAQIPKDILEIEDLGKIPHEIIRSAKSPTTPVTPTTSNSPSSSQDPSKAQEEEGKKEGMQEKPKKAEKPEDISVIEKLFTYNFKKLDFNANFVKTEWHPTIFGLLFCLCGGGNLISFRIPIIHETSPDSSVSLKKNIKIDANDLFVETHKLVSNAMISDFSISGDGNYLICASKSGLVYLFRILREKSKKKQLAAEKPDNMIENATQIQDIHVEKVCYWQGSLNPIKQVLVLPIKSNESNIVVITCSGEHATEYSIWSVSKKIDQKKSSIDVYREQLFNLRVGPGVQEMSLKAVLDVSNDFLILSDFFSPSIYVLHLSKDLIPSSSALLKNHNNKQEELQAPEHQEMFEKIINIDFFMKFDSIDPILGLNCVSQCTETSKQDEEEEDENKFFKSYTIHGLMSSLNGKLRTFRMPLMLPRIGQKTSSLQKKTQKYHFDLRKRMKLEKKKAAKSTKPAQVEPARHQQGAQTRRKSF